jgi:acyl-CoA dehydrogenase family protein 9
MNVALESSHCKLYGTTRCCDTLYNAQQTAGGAGYLTTLPYEKRLRDFRVTTIFEGTTEIHSFYPPLALFRWYGKKLQAVGTLGKLLLLGRIRRIQGLRHWAAGERNPVLKRAILTAARGEALFRQFLSHGLRAYGKDIAAEGFFLRRMNNISLSLKGEAGASR